MDDSKTEHDQQVVAVQKQVDKVVNLMKQNVQTVIKRGENLDELDDRADKLEKNAKQFQINATKLKKKYWWSNMKMKLYFGAIAIIILIVLFYWIFHE